jgi:hypothetical protein
MALGVEFKDKQNGGGAEAHVTGSGGGTVSVYTSRVTGDTWPPPEWSDPPLTRVGDGVVDLPLTPGSYFGYVAAATLTPPIWFGVTDPGEIAVATACRDAVAARLALVSLPGIKKIHQETFLESANKDWPCIVLSVDGLQEQEEAGLDGLDLIGHPVRLSICDTMALRDRAKLRERYEPWRERISNAFRWQKIPGVSDRPDLDDLYNHTTVETLDIADPRNPTYTGFVSAMIVWCWVYRKRGI